MATTVYERYGGFPAVHQIVSAFYDKVLESDRLHGFFAGSDMRSLIDHQTKFVAALMGGPAAYSDEVLRQVHERLDITHQDFVEVSVLLRETLEDFELEPQHIELVCDEFKRREACIVTADSRALAQ